MKVLVVDDHAVVRDGIRRLLSDAGMAVVTCPGAREALGVFRSERPDVSVLDIELRDGSGLELLRRICSEAVSARVVIFSMHGATVYARSALRSGALGFVSKAAEPEQLVTAVREAFMGRRYVDRETARELSDAAESPVASVRELTPREAEILHLVAEGRSLNEIAATLGTAYKTVANQITRLREKLGLERNADLIRFALENRQIRTLSDE